jgi:hypothetical protein
VIEDPEDRVRNVLDVAPDLRLPWDLRDDLSIGGAFAADLNLVLALAVWDSEFRAAGLYAGNIYLASEASVRPLLRVVGLPSEPDVVADDELDESLRRLVEVELIYRFPVAVKFRGEFGPDKQFRLNGWGRRLASRVTSDLGVDRTDALHTAAARHLELHRALYAAHMDLLADLDAHPVGSAWTSSTQLPVGVLF